MIINEDEHIFYGKNSLYDSIKFLFSLKINISNIYVHNLDYDGRFILTILKKYDYKINWMCPNGRIVYLKIWNGFNFIEFRCSYALFPIKLDDAAKSLGKSKMYYPHKKIKSYNDIYYIGELKIEDFYTADDYYNYIKINNKVINLEKYCKEYCMNDVKLTKEFVEKYMNILYSLKLFKKDWSIPITMASLSMRIFIRLFIDKNEKTFFIENDEDFDIMSPNIKINNFLKKAYHGGMVVAYGNAIENEVVFQSDYSGFYANYVMKINSFGYNKLTKISKRKIKYINKKHFKIGFYHIKIEIDMKYPILPVKIKGKLYFPNGIIEGYWYSDEINFALKYGAKIIEIYDGYVYNNTKYLFTNFINRMNELKKIGSVEKILGKNLSNSLYGRFGLNIEKDVWFIHFNKHSNIVDMIVNKKINSIRVGNKRIIKIRYYDYQKLYKLYKLYPQIFEIYIKKPWLDYHNQYIIKDEKKIIGDLAIAAAITAIGRVKLMTDAYKIEEDGGRLLYTDTDSHFVAYPNGKNINGNNVIGTKVGDVIFDAEKKDTILTKSIFLSPKFYAYEYKNNDKIYKVVKCKGARKMDISIDLLYKNFTNNKIIKYSGDYLEKKELYLKKNIVNKNFSPFIESKRKWNDNKTSSIAYNIDEIHPYR